MSRQQWRNRSYIDATRLDRCFKVRRLHNNFLTRFGGRDMKQTTYTREPYKSIKFTCIVVCLRETIQQRQGPHTCTSTLKQQQMPAPALSNNNEHPYPHPTFNQRWGPTSAPPPSTGDEGPCLYHHLQMAMSAHTHTTTFRRRQVPTPVPPPFNSDKGPGPHHHLQWQWMPMSAPAPSNDDQPLWTVTNAFNSNHWPTPAP